MDVRTRGDRAGDDVAVQPRQADEFDKLWTSPPRCEAGGPPRRGYFESLVRFRGPRRRATIRTARGPGCRLSASSSPHDRWGSAAGPVDYEAGRRGPVDRDAPQGGRERRHRRRITDTFDATTALCNSLLIVGERGVGPINRDAGYYDLWAVARTNPWNARRRSPRGLTGSARRIRTGLDAVRATLADGSHTPTTRTSSPSLIAPRQHGPRWAWARAPRRLGRSPRPPPARGLHREGNLRQSRIKLDGTVIDGTPRRRWSRERCHRDGARTGRIGPTTERGLDTPRRRSGRRPFTPFSIAGAIERPYRFRGLPRVRGARPRVHFE